VISELFRAAAAPRPGSLAAFFLEHEARGAGLTRPIDRAIVGGALADRLGFAFAAGYDAALAALVPDLPRARRVLAATEQGGGHPRAIRTTLTEAGDALELTGEKQWTTLAHEAGELLVVATRGTDAAGRNRLVVARVDARAPGLVVTPMPEPPFAPEIVHAKVSLEGVRIDRDRVLPGDGYDRYLKPFRTIEDLHVHGAVLGYFAGVLCRQAGDAARIERALALVVAVRALAAEDPRDPGAHLALAGVLREAALFLQDLEPAWAHVDRDERARFERDRALLDIAGKAREARRMRAWETFSFGPRADQSG
jgi:alkylation response protein AidB-like acyl-CoA dehydrogenase